MTSRYAALHSTSRATDAEPDADERPFAQVFAAHGHLSRTRPPRLPRFAGCVAFTQPENLLLSDTTENARVMISDFGLSKITAPDQVMKTACGTLGYAGTGRPALLRAGSACSQCETHGSRASCSPGGAGAQRLQRRGGRVVDRGHRLRVVRQMDIRGLFLATPTPAPTPTPTPTPDPNRNPHAHPPTTIIVLIRALVPSPAGSAGTRPFTAPRTRTSLTRSSWATTTFRRRTGTTSATKVRRVRPTIARVLKRSQRRTLWGGEQPKTLLRACSWSTRPSACPAKRSVPMNVAPVRSVCRR